VAAAVAIAASSFVATATSRFLRIVFVVGLEFERCTSFNFNVVI
jgi:hypothetical protein